MGGAKKVEINGRGTVLSLLFLEDGNHFLSGGDASMIRQWRIDSGAEVGQAMKTGSTVTSMALSNDGKWLVSGGERVANVWSMKSRQTVLTVSEHSQWVDTVHVHPDSTKFVTGSNDKKVFVWDISTGKRLVGPLKHNGRVGAVRFSPKGDRIATITKEKLCIYDTNDGKLVGTIPVSVPSYPSNLISWSGDQTIFALVSQKTVVHVDVNTGKTSSSWTVPGEPVNHWWTYDLGSIVLSSNGRFIASAVGHVVSFWDTFTCSLIASRIHHSSPIWAIALSSDDSLLAIGDSQGKISLYNLKDFITGHYLVGDRTAQELLSRDVEVLQPQIEALREEFRELQLRFDELSGTTTRSNDLPRTSQDVPLRISRGIWRIRSSAVGLYLISSKAEGGAIVVQGLDASDDSQKWTISPVADGSYIIMGRRDGSDVLLTTGSANALVCAADGRTTWTIDARGNAYVIGNAANAMAMHVHLGGDGSEGVRRTTSHKVSASLRDNSENQRWVLERVGDAD